MSNSFIKIIKKLSLCRALGSRVSAKGRLILVRVGSSLSVDLALRC